MAVQLRRGYRRFWKNNGIKLDLAYFTYNTFYYCCFAIVQKSAMAQKRQSFDGLEDVRTSVETSMRDLDLPGMNYYFKSDANSSLHSYLSHHQLLVYLLL